jgi:hypothetical protein
MFERRHMLDAQIATQLPQNLVGRMLERRGGRALWQCTVSAITAHSCGDEPVGLPVGPKGVPAAEAILVLTPPGSTSMDRQSQDAHRDQK